jgi:hypothetical protein
VVACRRVAELGKSSFWFKLEVETSGGVCGCYGESTHHMVIISGYLLRVSVFLPVKSLISSQVSCFVEVFKRGEREIGEAKV